MIASSVTGDIVADAGEAAYAMTKAALVGLTKTVPHGAVYGLVGPNGAGKSTILRHIMEVYRPDSGSI